MASITWAVSGGRVVEVVDGTFRETNISVDDFNAGRLPYGRIVGDPYVPVPHQDSPTNFDVSTLVAPWLESVYRGDPLPGMQPILSAETGQISPGDLSGNAPYRLPLGLPKEFYLPSAPLQGQSSTASGVGLDTATGAPKVLAVVGPRDDFIGGKLGEVRFVGPGPLVGEMSGIRIGTLPRIIF